MVKFSLYQFQWLLCVWQNIISIRAIIIYINTHFIQKSEKDWTIKLLPMRALSHVKVQNSLFVFLSLVSFFFFLLKKFLYLDLGDDSHWQHHIVQSSLFFLNACKQVDTKSSLLHCLLVYPIVSPSVCLVSVSPSHFYYETMATGLGSI